MVTELRQFLGEMKTYPGASDDLIARSEAELGMSLPGDYVEFLRITNGGVGSIGKCKYVIFWAVDELAPLNRDYQVQEYVPGFLVFGSSGGGEAYGFDTRRKGWPVVRITFVGLDWDEAIPMGESFAAFLKQLYEGEG